MVAVEGSERSADLYQYNIDKDCSAELFAAHLMGLTSEARVKSLLFITVVFIMIIIVILTVTMLTIVHKVYIATGIP